MLIRCAQILKLLIKLVNILSLVLTKNTKQLNNNNNMLCNNTWDDSFFWQAL